MFRRAFLKALGTIGLGSAAAAASPSPTPREDFPKPKKRDPSRYTDGQEYEVVVRFHGMGGFRMYPSSQVLRDYGVDEETIRDINLNNHKYAICRPDGEFSGDLFEIRRYYR